MNPQATIVPIASISKVFTATAVVQLADRGRLGLDADVNRYLKTVRVPAGPPVTAKHLLTHTAGFDALRGRLIETAAERAQPLDRFIATRLVRVHPPGEMTSYSSFGTDARRPACRRRRGHPVRAVPGVQHLGAAEDEPHPDHDPRLPARRSRVGLRSGRKEIVPIPHERYHSTPASSISSTAGDMGRYMLALLGEGALAGERILSEKATRETLSQQVTLHPRLPGFGYGFQISDTTRAADRRARTATSAASTRSWSCCRSAKPASSSPRTARAPTCAGRCARRSSTGGSPIRAPRRAPLPIPPRRRVSGAWPGRTAPTSGHTCPFDRDRVQDVDVTVNSDGTLTVWDERSSGLEVAPLFFRPGRQASPRVPRRRAGARSRL